LRLQLSFHCLISGVVPNSRATTLGITTLGITTVRIGPLGAEFSYAEWRLCWVHFLLLYWMTFSRTTELIFRLLAFNRKSFIRMTGSRMRFSRMTLSKMTCCRMAFLWMTLRKLFNFQQNDIQKNDINQNDTRQNDIKMNASKKNSFQQNDIEKSHCGPFCWVSFCSCVVLLNVVAPKKSFDEKKVKTHFNSNRSCN
jgi:hypothetical protein